MFNQQILEQMIESNQVRENNREEAEKKEASRIKQLAAIEFARSFS